MIPSSSLVISQGWGLIDLPLRASNEGLLRPRVARAQKIIRLHPLLCSASKKGTWPLPPLLAGFFSILLSVARWARKAYHAHRNKSGPDGTVCSREAVRANGPATPTLEPERK